ncbi:MAG: hypothetical protein J0H34_20815 [Rhizobiales bacterium]|nr:hypothetical protein [Hyphomicrobiales bacterium]
MSEPRPLRSILAECVRAARLGPTTFTWASLGEAGQEELHREADRTIRLLEANGVRLTRFGEPDPVEQPPSSPVIYSDKIVGRNAERQLRRGADDKWEVLKVEAGDAAVQLTFSLMQAYELAGRALQGDREVASAPGILTTLAAALEIHRCHAVTL